MASLEKTSLLPLFVASTVGADKNEFVSKWQDTHEGETDETDELVVNFVRDYFKESVDFSILKSKYENSSSNEEVRQSFKNLLAFTQKNPTSSRRLYQHLVTSHRDAFESKNQMRVKELHNQLVKFKHIFPAYPIPSKKECIRSIEEQSDCAIS